MAGFRRGADYIGNSRQQTMEGWALNVRIIMNPPLCLLYLTGHLENYSMSSEANRRKLLKALTLGSGAVTLSQVPNKWRKPVVESVVLPAHAQTTGEEVQTPGRTPVQQDFSLVFESGPDISDPSCPSSATVCTEGTPQQQVNGTFNYNVPAGAVSFTFLISSNDGSASIGIVASNSMVSGDAISGSYNLAGTICFNTATSVDVSVIVTDSNGDFDIISYATGLTAITCP